MKNSYHFNHITRIIALLVATAATPWALNSCQKKTDDPKDASTEISYVAELHQNALPNDLSDLISSQASSPIHWQKWNQNLFTNAASEQKTVFAFIGSGTDSNTLEILDRLNKSPSSCALLNKHHASVFIDSNIHPDAEFFASMLCNQSRNTIATPLLVWFSYEGNPISWSPVTTNASRNIDNIISRMSNTVYQVWTNDPDYVLKNSRNDFKQRMNLTVPKPKEKDVTIAALKAVRRTASLYDPTSGSIDGIGKLSPSRFIDLLVQTSYHADLPESQSKRYSKTAALAADHILIKGLIDPLDGGIYAGIQKTTSALPQFTKTLRAQAFAMKALYSLYQTTGNESYLRSAESIMAYTEKHLTLPDGGYLSGIIYTSNQAQDNPCVWTLEEIEATLTKEEVRICTIAFGLRGLGNIPLIDDPDRSYFRKNTFTWKVTPSELATQTSLDLPTLKKRLESITKKLAKLRTEKPTKPFVENLSTSGSSALYVSACVAGYRATGNPSYLEKAKKNLNYIKTNFLDESGNLHRTRFSGKLGQKTATGGDFALVCRAGLDLHEITLDSSWLQFSYDLHQRMNKLLADPNTYYVKEYGTAYYPQSYHGYIYYTLRALNNSSTWSHVYSNAKRLSLRLKDEAIDTQAANLENALSGGASTASISSVDFLTEFSKLNQKTVYIKAPVKPGLLLAACKNLCQIVLVTDAGTYHELGAQTSTLPAGSATVTSQGKVIGTSSDAAKLHALLK